MRIIFMGTPDFAAETLKALIEAGHDIALVVTQPDKPKGRGGKVQMSDVKQCAIEHGLNVFQPDKVKTAESVAELRKYEPELIVVAAFGQILSKEILDMPVHGCINVHASLLPRLRGASPIQTAILEGDDVTGVTIQQMNEGVDTGDILSRTEVMIEPSDTGGSLFDKLAKAGAALAADTIKKLEAGRVVPVPQDESGATHARLIDKSMGVIDWNKDAAEIQRMIRAFNPWPSAYTELDGKMLKIWQAEAYDKKDGDCGEVTEVTKDEIIIACGEGSLALKEIQLEGKKRMTVHDFLLGYKVEKGTRL